MGEHSPMIEAHTMQTLARPTIDLAPAILAVRNYGLRNPRTIAHHRPSHTPIARLFRQCGHYAAARHCYKLGIGFAHAYFAAFGRYPTR